MLPWKATLLGGPCPWTQAENWVVQLPPSAHLLGNKLQTFLPTQNWAAHFRRQSQRKLSGTFSE